MGFFKSVGKVLGKVGKSVAKVAPAILPAVGSFFGGPTGAAIGSAVGGLFAGDRAEQGQIDVNEANSAQAQRQMDFQERMSNTSWQRGMEDMRLAGLNPIFAYKAGGASTPNGAMAVMQNAEAAGVDAFAKGANTAINLAAQKHQLKTLAEQAKNANYQGALIQAQEGLNTQQSAMLATQMASAKQQADQEAIRTKVMESTLPVVQHQNKSFMDNPSRYELKQWLGSVGALLGGGNSALSYKQVLTGGK